VLDYDSDDFHASTAVHGLAHPHGGEWKRRKHEAASASSNMQYAGKDGGYSHQPNGMSDPWALVRATTCRRFHRSLGAAPLSCTVAVE
jgi:hypothetical protein